MLEIRYWRMFEMYKMILLQKLKQNMQSVSEILFLNNYLLLIPIPSLQALSGAIIKQLQSPAVLHPSLHSYY